MLLPPLPPRTHVLVQSKHLTTITTPTASHSAAASPPNFKLNHCNRRRLPSLSARALHPSQQHQLAAKWSNAFGPFVGRVLFHYSFIKLLLQRSSSRQQNHVPCMQGQRQQLVNSRWRALVHVGSAAQKSKRLLTALSFTFLQSFHFTALLCLMRPPSKLPSFAPVQRVCAGEELHVTAAALIMFFMKRTPVCAS